MSCSALAVAPYRHHSAYYRSSPVNVRILSITFLLHNPGQTSSQFVPSCSFGSFHDPGISAGLEGALGNIVYRLFSCRLLEGPRPGWESVDDALRDVFEAKLDITPPRQTILVALDVLRTEKLGRCGQRSACKSPSLTHWMYSE